MVIDELEFSSAEVTCVFKLIEPEPLFHLILLVRKGYNQTMCSCRTSKATDLGREGHTDPFEGSARTTPTWCAKCRYSTIVSAIERRHICSEGRARGESI